MAYLDEDLIKLHQSHILPQTLIPPRCKDQFQRQLLLSNIPTLKPPLRLERIRIVAPYLLILEYAPSAVAYLGAAGDEHAIDGVTSGMDFLGHKTCDWRVDAEAFLEDRL